MELKNYLTNWLILFVLAGITLDFGFNVPISFSQETCIGYIVKAESSFKQTQLETNSAKNQLVQLQQRQKQIQVLVDQGAGARSELSKINQQVKQRQTELKQAIATEKKAQAQLRSLRMMSSCAV
jgi:multidrug resistance efflux pump